MAGSYLLTLSRAHKEKRGKDGGKEEMLGKNSEKFDFRSVEERKSKKCKNHVVCMLGKIRGALKKSKIHTICALQKMEYIKNISQPHVMCTLQTKCVERNLENSC